MARIGIALPREEDGSREQQLEWAQLGEAKGYESLWVPEAWGRDAFTLATQVAMITKRIKIGTGIVTVFSRTPSMLAQTAGSLDQISNGRMILGLGTSGPAVIENWHGIKYEKPLRRTREYIEIIRLALSGERVNYDGEIFKLKGFKLPFKPVQQQIPIYIASLGPQNIRLTGEIADGWLPVYLSPSKTGLMMDDLAAGAKKAGRSLSDVDVSAFILCAVSKDEAKARQLLAEHLAYYVGGMGTFYGELMTRYGFGDEAEAIQSAWAARDRKAAAAAVSDRVLEALAVMGTPAQARQKIEEYRQAGVNQPVLTFPHGAGEMISETIEALAPQG